jgi:hypothetical protein
VSAQPHTRQLIVWDVPAAIEPGVRFRVKIGVKCTTAACRPDRWLLAVCDHDGNTLATPPLGDEPWPGTAALFVADVELRAPDFLGAYAWSARVSTTNGETPHVEAGASFTIRTVPAPECVLNVIAIDKVSRLPVPGAKVVAHPYRTLTNEHGRAELRVPKGAYRLFVSGAHYLPFRSDCDAQTEATISAELEPDRGPSARCAMAPRLAPIHPFQHPKEHVDGIQ